MSSKKILVLAYAISPYRGSEYSVAWNYVTEMSKSNELVVIYGTSGSHMGDIEEMKKYIKEISLRNVCFVDVKPNLITNCLNALNFKGIFAYSFYISYNMWHRQVYKRVKVLINQEHFDLIHYLAPIGFREPGYLWKINLPYIWGPIGGIPNRPVQLFKALPFKSKITFTLRNLVNTFQFKYNNRLRKAFQHTDILLTATTENQYLIKKHYNKNSIYCSENGIINSSKIAPLNLNNLNSDYIINLIWIGSIDARKSLNILLEALSKLHSSNWNLHVIGDGPRKVEMQKLSMKLKIDKRINWHGHIDREEVFELFKISHIHVITSLGEATTTTLWEAMSNGIPTISLDHCGMHDIICEKCGILIPILTYEKVIEDLALKLDHLILNPVEINNLSNGVIECANKYTWNQRQDFFNNIYELAIDNWNKRQNQK